MPQLPPDLWFRPPIADALATCDMATVLEGVRSAHGWSQGKLASEIAYSQSWVSRVVNGQQALTVTQVHDLAVRLGIPLYLLRFGGVPTPPKEVKATKRRDFGKAVAAGALATALPSGPCREPVDRSTAPALRSITGGQRRMDAYSPARHLLPGAMAHVHLSEHMLANAHGTSHYSAISAAVSEASGFAAWLHADQGDADAARMHYRTAVIRARQAGMCLLDSYMLGSLAAFETETAQDPGLGLGLVQEAEHVLPSSAHPTAHAWLACVTALAHAAAGDRAGTAQALARAERHAGRSDNTDPPWPWVFPFDTAKVTGYRALAAVRLDEPDQARAAFAEAPRSGTNAKQEAILRVELATAHAGAGDLDEAFRLASEALGTAIAFGSTRILERVRAFRSAHGASGARCVRELDDRLAVLADRTDTSG